MKTLTIIAAVLTATSTLLAQNIKPSRPGATYDSNGHLIKYVYPDGTRELYAYDLQGGMSAFTNRAGNVTHFASSRNGAYDATSEPTISTSAPLDGGLYANYFMDTSHTFVNFDVCGSLPQSFGCYGGPAGSGLGPFGKVGALIEGNPSTDQSTGTVSRAIYVLDVASGSNLNGVTLYVYTRTDVISPSDDMVSVTLSNTISLPLLGGSSALASMAANAKVLVVGTNQSPDAIVIQKRNFHMTQIAGGFPPINVDTITSDQYGYITATFGSFNSNDTAFVVLGPDGTTQGSGGGFEFLVNTVQGILPPTFP